MLRRASVLTVALMVLGGLAVAQESFLLTDNGLANEKHSEYKDANHFKTEGVYEIAPGFSGGVGEQSPVSFAEGRLTNGDSSFDYKRDPSPYVYWQNEITGELIFHLRRECRIDKVRLCLLSREDGPHGTANVDVYVTGDPLEFPDVLKVGTIAPADDGWNELAVGRSADGLRLVLSQAPGKSYITVSEVEIWGEAIGEVQAEPITPTRSEDPKRVEDGITWWAFDFGPKKSPSFARFFVCDSHEVYAPDKGFGWIPYEGGEPVTVSNFGLASDSVPGLGERDRAGAVSDALYRDLLASCEYYHTQVRQTFAVDVPDGTYQVMTMHGDIQYGRAGEQSYWIEAEGLKVVDNISLPASLTADVEFTVEVADGRLDLTLDAANPNPASRGFCINGLVILPANTQAERDFAGRKKELLRASIERVRHEAFDKRFREVPYEETALMVEPSAEDSARGFIGWAPNWMDRIFPNSVPDEADVKRPCATFATPGEYEPVTVAMTTLRDLEDVTVSVGDLVGEAGTIPASAIEVRKVGYWKQRIGSSWSKEWRTMPELLELFQDVDVAQGVTQEFWLTIKVPEDAAAGTYEGPITVSAPGGAWQTTLSLQVLAFRLEPAERPVGMYWRDTWGTRERLDMQIRDMLEHGITAVTMNLSPTFESVDGKLALDTAELLEFLQHLKQMGITGPVPYHAGIEGKVKRAVPDTDFDEAYVEAVRQLQEVSAREDTLQLLFYPVDEIGNSDDKGERANRLCALIARVPGATSYITVNNYAGGEKWGDTFDIWCGNIVYTAEEEQRLLARGKCYMRYGSAYHNSCRRARSSSGLGFYRRPAEAMYYWHYQAYNCDPFNDFDGAARDWCAAYPGPDGPIPTLDWEAIREGVDDMRYIATLKALASRTGQGNAAQQQAAQKALAELEAVLGVDDGISQSGYAEDLSDDEFNDLRRRLAVQIQALMRVP